MIGSNHKIGLHHDLEPSRQRVPVDRSKYWLWEVREERKAFTHRLHVFSSCERFQIHASAKDLLTGTGNHHSPYFGVFCGVAQCVDETLPHGRVQRVTRFGPIDRHHEDAVG